MILTLISRATHGGGTPPSGGGGDPDPGDGTYDYLEPLYTLPTGMSYNSTTGLVEGTTIDTTYSAPATEVTITNQGSRSANAAALASAISTAAASGTGTRIMLTAGVDFGGSYTLPTNNSSGWIYIETTAVKAGTFVAAGTRVGTSDASSMPQMYATGVSSPVFVLPSGNAKYRFVGLEFALAPSGVSWNADTSATGNLDQGFINGTYEGATLATYPNHVVVDRCYLHGTSGTNLKRPMYMNGGNIAVIDSYIDEVRQATSSGQSDGQGFLATAGPGPYKLDNNTFRVGARGEHVLWGGGGNGQIPADIQVTRNLFDFPTAWWGTLDVKNMYEHKIGFRVLVQGNEFRNYRSTGVGSQYFAIVLKSVDQSAGSFPLSQTRHVSFRLNKFVNCSAGFQLAENPESTATDMTDIEISGNAIYEPTSDYSGVPRDWSVQFDAIASMAIRHNTFYATSRMIADSFAWLGTGMSSNGGSGHTWSDNLVVMNASLGSGNYWLSTDNGNGNGNTAASFLGATFTGNAFTRTSTVPSGNTTVASQGAADLVATTLALNPTSPLKGVATSGRDPGAVHSLITAAMA